MAEVGVLAPLAVGVEGVARDADGALHVRHRAVGHRADDLLGGRVLDVERTAALGLDELATDEHPLLAGENTTLVLYCGHAVCSFGMVGSGRAAREGQSDAGGAWLP